MDSEPLQEHAGAEAGGARDGAALLIVGIGAAEGGVDALHQLIAQLPAKSGMAFVIILRLPSQELHNAPAILQQQTTIPVVPVNAATPVAPNHIYVIPPDRHLTMVYSRLELAEREHAEEQRAPIDLFFRTLAEAHGRNAAAIVLSGVGQDGAMGVQRVKEREGLTLVQIPEEAAFVEMPYSAIATGLVDYVLPVAQMPAQLHDFYRQADRIVLPADLPPSTSEPQSSSETDEAVLREIFTTLRLRTGHNFSQYKRSTLFRRIGRRMQVTNADSLAAYRDVLRAHPEEVQALLRDLLISVTNFFRDRDAWSLLEAILPLLFAGKGPADQVRVWVAGCATGEEAYSVAMLLHEHAATLEQPPAIQIFATDIDEDAIATARQGRYPETIAVDVPRERLERAFMHEQRHYRVKKDIRDLVLFAPHNLLHDPPFSKLDLITCRNLLIYLNREVQTQIMQLFHYSLRPEGYLLLGNAETTDGVPGLFAPVEKTQRLFRRQEAGRTQPVFLPAMPLPGTGSARPVRGRHTPAAPGQSFGELHQQLMAQHTPASVIVNAEYDVVHLSQGAGRFVQLGAGEPTTNLLKLVHHELQLELRTALFAIAQGGEQPQARQARVTLDGQPRLVELRVEPIREPDWAQGSMLVIFNDIADVTMAQPPVTSNIEPMVRALEELRQTKAQLGLTIEQHDTTVEEYRAANEELQAMNEEQRAAAEELETSKEELQSINEELTTVNQALKHKVDEVTAAHSDLQNLQAATQIATLFLDRQLRIKRYIPSAEALFNIIPADIGRPFAHITHQLADAQLAREAALVLQTLQAREHELQSTDERTYLARFQPYRTTDDRIDGVVLTFVDITERKRMEETLRASEEQFRRAIEDAPIPVLMHAEDGEVLQISRTWTELTGYTLADVPTVDAWLNHAYGDGADQVRNHVHRLFAGEERSLNVTFDLRTRTGELRHWSFSASAPGRLRDGRRFVVGMALDITERRQTEMALAEKARLLDLSNDAIIVRDTHNRIVYWNHGATELYGWTREEAIGKDMHRLLQTEFEAPIEQLITTLQERDRMEGEVIQVTRAGRRITALSRWALDRDRDGRPGAILTTYNDITEHQRAAELQQLSIQRQELLHRLMTAQEDERQRIARELHDTLGQFLSALNLRLSFVQSLEGILPTAREELAKLQALAGQIDRELDRLTMELRPLALDHFGLADALGSYGEQWTAASGVPVEVLVVGLDGTRLAPVIETTTYRIVQEALTNVLKHAQATSVSVLVERQAGVMRVVIEDNGVGFNPSQGRSDGTGGRQVGLIGMAERAALAGGAVTIESEPGAGTAIYLQIPIGEDTPMATVSS